MMMMLMMIVGQCSLPWTASCGLELDSPPAFTKRSILGGYTCKIAPLHKEQKHQLLMNCVSEKFNYLLSSPFSGNPNEPLPD
jgi:hypothetical protein